MRPKAYDDFKADLAVLKEHVTESKNVLSEFDELFLKHYRRAKTTKYEC